MKTLRKSRRDVNILSYDVIRQAGITLTVTDKRDRYGDPIETCEYEGKTWKWSPVYGAMVEYSPETGRVVLR